MKSVAELMREWRRLAGVNTAQAGLEIGLSPRSIEDIEQGRTRADDVLTRYGLEAMIKQAKLHCMQDVGQRSAAIAAVNERKKRSPTRKKTA